MRNRNQIHHQPYESWKPPEPKKKKKNDAQFSSRFNQPYFFSTKYFCFFFFFSPSFTNQKIPSQCVVGDLVANLFVFYARATSVLFASQPDLSRTLQSQQA